MYNVASAVWQVMSERGRLVWVAKRVLSAECRLDIIDWTTWSRERRMECGK